MQESLEGWTPEPRDAADLAHVIDLAFDYRGDVTVVMRDGTERHGYLGNRNADVAEPFIDLFEPDGATPLTIRYADIRTIRFTGKDTAAGKSFAAWLERKDVGKPERGSTADA